MHRFNKISNSKKGFTLIEMLVVILIIVILLAVAIPSVIAYRDDSQETADKGAAKLVYTALEAALTNYDPIKASTGVYSQPAGSDIVFTLHRMKPQNAPGWGSSHTMVTAANEFLKYDEFTGFYEFGYNTVTNSIAWVSYHEEPNLSTTDTTAPSGKVMLYHVEDDVIGYLDELGNVNGVNYNQAPYTHQ